MKKLYNFIFDTEVGLLVFTLGTMAVILGMAFLIHGFFTLLGI